MARVHIPRSVGRRGALTYAKLLRRVDPGAPSGAFSYQGRFLRPGAEVEEADLRPAADWPAKPVLLECAGPAGGGWGHRRAAYLYILWVYEGADWREVARAQSVGAEWTWDLAGPARRAMGEGNKASVVVDVKVVARKVAAILRAELAALPAEQRPVMATLVHDELAARMVA
jgi:hypothetical protein